MSFLKRGTLLRVKSKFFLLSAVILLVGLGGVNSGENQVLFFFSMILAAVGVSGFFSKRNVERIGVELVPPQRAFCCEETLVKLVLKNPHFYPRFAIWIKKGGKDVFAGDIDKRETKEIVLRQVFRKRGYNSFPEITLWSEFPLGLVIRGKTINFKEKILVYPRLYNVKPYFPEELIGEGEDKPSQLGNEEVHYVKEVEEAEPRKIYWKGFARTGKLLEKVLGGSFGERIVVALDPYGSGLIFEEKISLIASLGYFLWKNHIFHFIFAGEFQGEVNEKNFDKFMATLALLKPGTREESAHLSSLIKTHFPNSNIFIASCFEDSPLKSLKGARELVFVK